MCPPFLTPPSMPHMEAQRTSNECYSPFWLEGLFSEVELPLYAVLGSMGYSTPPVLSPDEPPTLGSGHGAQPSQRRCPSALVSLPRDPYCPSRSGPLGAPWTPLRSARRACVRSRASLDSSSEKWAPLRRAPRAAQSRSHRPSPRPLGRPVRLLRSRR